MRIFSSSFLLAGFIAFFILPAKVSADSIVSFANLHFHSQFEEKAFMQLKSDSVPDYFYIFLAADKSITENDYKNYKEKLNLVLSPFNKKSFLKLKAKKKVSKVFKQVQDQLMDKYVETALFSDLFKKGEYQCVTSSMLFSDIFDKLGIPYQINFVPNHVYLTAYPETAKVIVQTTSPEKGVVVYDKVFKSKYVQYLRKNKLIGKNDYETQSVDELFARYYLKNDTADLKQLAAMQYTNMAIFNLQNSEIDESFNNMLKAYYLNPDSKNKFMLTLTLGMKMDNTDVADSLYAPYFVMFYKLTRPNVNNETIISIFQTITDNQLKKKGDVTLYKKSYSFIANGISDSALRNKISFYYSWEMGIWFFNQQQSDKAKPYLEKALLLQPDNLKVQSLIVKLFALQAQAFNSDTKKFIVLYDSSIVLFNRHKSLQKNNKYVNLLYKMELRLAGNYYYRGKPNEGLPYLNKFEEMAAQTQIPLSYRTEQIVERAYSSIAVYYYKRNLVLKARSAVKQGLKYYPDSFNLQERLKALN